MKRRLGATSNHQHLGLDWTRRRFERSILGMSLIENHEDWSDADYDHDGTTPRLKAIPYICTPSHYFRAPSNRHISAWTKCSPVCMSLSLMIHQTGLFTHLQHLSSRSRSQPRSPARILHFGPHRTSQSNPIYATIPKITTKKPCAEFLNGRRMRLV